MPCPHFGNLPAEYNRAVHGNYYPWRYYGKGYHHQRQLSQTTI